jgi:hypothetical protein
VQKAEKVARTVEHLLDAGAEGDLAAAKALVPWIDQAYGKPTERVEHKHAAHLHGYPPETTRARGSPSRGSVHDSPREPSHSFRRSAYSTSPFSSPSIL